MVWNDYVIKWVEVYALANVKEENVVDLLYNNIMQGFGAP